MPNHNRSIHVILTLEQYERLAKRSAETGAPISELVRRAVDAAIPATKAKP